MENHKWKTLKQQKESGMCKGVYNFEGNRYNNVQNQGEKKEFPTAVDHMH